MEKKLKRRGRPAGTHPPQVLTASLHILLTPEQKQWVLDHGGGDYIRWLVALDRLKKETRSVQEVETGHDSLVRLIYGRIEDGEPLRVTWLNDDPDFGGEKEAVEGFASWAAKPIPGLPPPIIVRSPDDWDRTLVHLRHILRVQEPGEDGAVLWEK